MYSITEFVKRSPAEAQKWSVIFICGNTIAQWTSDSKVIGKSFKHNLLLLLFASFVNANSSNFLFTPKLFGNSRGNFPFGSNPKYVCSLTCYRKGVYELKVLIFSKHKFANLISTIYFRLLLVYCKEKKTLKI